MNYKLNPTLTKIEAPIILIIDGNEQTYENSKALTELSFEKHYLVDKIFARNNAVVVVLKQNNKINEINWVGEEAVSFF